MSKFGFNFSKFPILVTDSFQSKYEFNRNNYIYKCENTNLLETEYTWFTTKKEEENENLLISWEWQKLIIFFQLFLFTAFCLIVHIGVTGSTNLTVAVIHSLVIMSFKLSTPFLTTEKNYS